MPIFSSIFGGIAKLILCCFHLNYILTDASNFCFLTTVKLCGNSLFGYLVRILLCVFSISYICAYSVKYTMHQDLKLLCDEIEKNYPMCTNVFHPVWLMSVHGKLDRLYMKLNSSRLSLELAKTKKNPSSQKSLLI